MAYMPQLDGLRALAAFAVMFSHWVPSMNLLFHAGLAAVRLFFVLSGFLITAILLSLRADCDGDASCRRAGVAARFYQRRAVRILPLYYAVLLAACAISPGIRAAFFWNALYLGNFRSFWTQTFTPPNHFWALCVEMQFYLVWPWILLFAPRRRLNFIIWGAVLLGPLSRAVLAGSGRMNVISTYLPFSNGDALGAGALLCVILRHRGNRAVENRVFLGSFLAGLVAATAIALALYAVRGPWRGSGSGLLYGTYFVFFDTALSCCFLGLVGLAASGLPGVPGRFLECAPVRYLGRISYAVYLMHPFVGRLVFRILEGGMFDRHGPGAVLAAAAATLALAAAATEWIEKPLARFRRPYRTALAAAPGSGA